MKSVFYGDVPYKLRRVIGIVNIITFHDAILTQLLLLTVYRFFLSAALWLTGHLEFIDGLCSNLPSVDKYMYLILIPSDCFQNSFCPRTLPRVQMDAAQPPIGISPYIYIWVLKYQLLPTGFANGFFLDLLMWPLGRGLYKNF